MALTAQRPMTAASCSKTRHEEPLLASAAKEADNVYEWSGGQLNLIGLLPGGSTPPAGSFAGPYQWEGADTSVGGALDQLYTENVISSDGSRVFFTAAGTGQLYVRENNAVSVQVSASQKTNGRGPAGTDPAGPRPAAFMTATPDGEEVFFTSAEELTNDANTGSADQGNDLYSYDVGSGQLIRPHGRHQPLRSKRSLGQGSVGVSEDGSYVYFVADGDLSGEEENADGAKAESGRPNLYLWHSGTTTFIATLSAAQHPGEVDSMDWAPSALAGIEKNSRVTPDGKTLLFASELPLTGYDSGGYTEFYRYWRQRPSSPASPAIRRRTRSGRRLSSGSATSGSPPIAHQAALTHNLSADGSRVFFVSPDPLVPQDTNGQLDVYEWEADGSGSCETRRGLSVPDLNGSKLRNPPTSPTPAPMAMMSSSSPRNGWSVKTRTMRWMSTTPGSAAGSQPRIRLPKRHASVKRASRRRRHPYQSRRPAQAPSRGRVIQRPLRYPRTTLQANTAGTGDVGTRRRHGLPGTPQRQSGEGEAMISDR